MTTEEALARREQLRDERARARRVRDEHAGVVRSLQEELRTLPRQRKAMIRDAARAGEEADTQEADARERAVRAEIERRGAALRLANEAAKAAEREERELIFAEWPAFAANAEQISEAARGLLDGLRDGRVPYADAYGGIEAARAEWSLIARAHNDVLAGQLDPAERAAGELRRRSVPMPPENPLRSPAEVFRAPLGPVVEPVEEAAA